MITITKGMALKENSDLVVYSDSGSYDANALIECAKAEYPETPYCSFEAQYIVDGNSVYDETQIPT